LAGKVSIGNLETKSCKEGCRRRKTTRTEGIKNAIHTECIENALAKLFLYLLYEKFLSPVPNPKGFVARTAALIPLHLEQV
jgi:hypothetical protein